MADIGPKVIVEESEMKESPAKRALSLSTAQPIASISQSVSNTVAYQSYLTLFVVEVSSSNLQTRKRKFGVISKQT